MTKGSDQKNFREGKFFEGSQFQRSLSIKGQLHSLGLEVRLNIMEEEWQRETAHMMIRKQRESLHASDTKYIPHSPTPNELLPPATPHLPPVTTQLTPQGLIH